MVTSAEEVLNAKLNFLCSVCITKDHCLNVNGKNRLFFYISVTPTKLSHLPDTTAQVSNNVDHGIFGYGKISDLTDSKVESAINIRSGENRWVRFTFPKVYEAEFMVICRCNRLSKMYFEVGNSPAAGNNL